MALKVVRLDDEDEVFGGLKHLFEWQTPQGHPIIGTARNLFAARVAAFQCCAAARCDPHQQNIESRL